jgi:hypothetical protein
VSNFIPEIYGRMVVDQLKQDSRMANLYYAPRRQWDLIWSLGQRPCSDGSHDWLAYLPCPTCGAVI